MDYSALAGSVVIPAFQNAVILDVQPTYVSAPYDGPKNVTLTLTNGAPNYALEAASATLTIADAGVNQAVNLPTVDGGTTWTFAPLGLTYSTSSSAHPIIAEDVRLAPTNNGAALSRVEVDANLGGIQAAPVYYSGNGVVANDLYRLAVEINATSLATGRYDWSMAVVEHYNDNSTVSNTYYGQKDVDNLNQSTLGANWTLGGLDRAVPHGNDVSVVLGSGLQANEVIGTATIQIKG